MKRVLPLIALGLVLSAHKCNTGSASMAQLMDTKWMLQSLNGKAIEVPAGVDTPWLQLAGTGEERSLTGFGGCNKLMGGFQLDGQRIGFPGVGSTKMYCENTAGLEKEFMTALRGTDTFNLDGNTLKLMQGATEVASLMAAK